MIWIILLALAALVGAYLLYPFLAEREEAADALLVEAKAQKAAIEEDEARGQMTADAAKEAKDALDRRILSILDAAPAARANTLKSAALYVVPAVLILGGVGVYTQIGAPNYQPVTVAEFQAARMAELPPTLDELVVVLSARLDADPNPPADLYVFLARSYFRLNQTEQGLAAYEKAVERSNSDPAIVAERDAAKEFASRLPSAPEIDPEAAAAIQSMSPEAQAQMIEGMVEGLALRLADNPNDIDGWQRLIRARLVMGNLDQARRDLSMAKSVFAADTPEARVLDAFEQELSQTPPSASDN